MSVSSNPNTVSRRVAAIAPVVLLAAAAALMLFAPLAAAGKKPPKRVVALTPFAANTMANLGVRPVAVGQTLGGDRRLAPVLNRTRKLTLTHPNGPNLEQLARLRPKLVFTSSQWSKGTQAMRQLGIRVIRAEPTTIGQVYKQTKKIAKIMKRKAKGKRLVRQMRRQTRRNTAGIKSRPKVMLILGVGRTPFTFLSNSWGGQIMRASGARMLTGGATGSGGFARISDEVVVAENPDIIVAVPHANTDDIPAMIDYIKTNPAWELTDAAQNDRVYVSTDNSLLQAGTDMGRVIRKVRSQYLKNR
jgi:iron complex transport system substrate-binding protein